MTDTAVAVNAYARTKFTGLFGPYYSNINIGIIVYVDNSGDLIITRTIDKGVNWSVLTTIQATIGMVACFYDREIPGVTTDLIHIAFLDFDLGTCRYITAGVSIGSDSQVSTIASGLTVSGSSSDEFDNKLSITRSKSGYIYVGYSTQVEIGCFRSDDFGNSWDAITDVYESGTQEDWVWMFPANTSDPNDICIIFKDRSSTPRLSIRMWDNSDSTWTTTSIPGIAASGARYSALDASIRHSDNKLLLVSATHNDNVEMDILTYEITIDSISTPIIVVKGNVVTDLAESGQPSIWINQINNEVRVVYLKGGVWASTVDVVFKISTDGMVSWGTEQPYSENTADDIKINHIGRTTGINGGRFQPCFFNDDLNYIFVNNNLDLEVRPFETFPGWRRKPMCALLAR